MKPGTQRISNLLLVCWFESLGRCWRIHCSLIQSFGLASNTDALQFLSRKFTSCFPGFLIKDPLCGRHGRRYSASYVPALKLNRYPRFFAATLAALPSISEIPFLDSLLNFLGGKATTLQHLDG